MPWFRVDDKLGGHPKVRAIPRARRRNAMGLWLLAGVWCADNVTTTDARDGNVPSYMLDELCSEPEDAAHLVRVALWHTAGHDCESCPQPLDADGWIFHEWESLQYTAEQIKAKRADEAERQRRSRERRRAEADSRPERVTRDKAVSNGPVQLSRPVPTRPDPTTVTQGGQRPETLSAAGATERPEDSRCTAHKGILDDPGPCRGCMIARERAEADSVAEKAERIRRRLECKRCGGTGLIEAADGSPVAKCDHRPLLEVVGE